MQDIGKGTRFLSTFLRYIHLFLYFLHPSISVYNPESFDFFLSWLVLWHRNASEIKGKRNLIHLMLVKYSSSMGRRSGVSIISVKLISHKDLHLMKMDITIAVLPYLSLNICKLTDHFQSSKQNLSSYSLFSFVCRI